MNGSFVGATVVVNHPLRSSSLRIRVADNICIAKPIDLCERNDGSRDNDRTGLVRSIVGETRRIQQAVRPVCAGSIPGIIVQTPGEVGGAQLLIGRIGIRNMVGP